MRFVSLSDVVFDVVVDKSSSDCDWEEVTTIFLFRNSSKWWLIVEVLAVLIDEFCGCCCCLGGRVMKVTMGTVWVVAGVVPVVL